MIQWEMIHFGLWKKNIPNQLDLDAQLSVYEAVWKISRWKSKNMWTFQALACRTTTMKLCHDSFVDCLEHTDANIEPKVTNRLKNERKDEWEDRKEAKIPEMPLNDGTWKGLGWHSVWHRGTTQLMGKAKRWRGHTNTSCGIVSEG